MNKKNWFGKLKVWVVSGAIITLIATLIFVIYSLGTVSNELYSAFSPGQQSNSSIGFNISGYNSLGLQ